MQIQVALFVPKGVIHATGVAGGPSGSRPIVLDLVEYFERQKRRCERELKYSEAPGFQLFERTAQGEQEITEQHIRQLREARDGYQRMIEYLKAQG